jgi:DinB superfamily
MQHTTMPFPSYDCYTTAELLGAYEAGPQRLRAVLVDLDEQAFQARPRGPGSWSINEITLHVTDSEIQGAFRIRKAWSEPGAPFPGYDQDMWTRVLRHQDAQAPERQASLDLFSALRRATAPLFQRATSADWERANGIHLEFGRLTFRNLLELYADHSERHIAQVLTIRELLGVPLEYAMLLPQRLF